ncbi:MAG: YncE family protein [Terriglobales bacterium]
MDAHQGYATDGKVHFLFGSKQVEKRANDGTWSVLAANSKVFVGTGGFDHLGDGDYYDGKLYVVAEYYKSCSEFSNPAIFVFDADTLKRLSVHKLAENQEVSGVAVDPGSQELWVSSFCDSSQVWVYDLTTMLLKRTVPLQPSLLHIQGIALGPDAFYLSKQEGSIWRMSRTGQTEGVYSTNIPGSHEGLDYSQPHLAWLIDSGVGKRFIYFLGPK